MIGETVRSVVTDPYSVILLVVFGSLAGGAVMNFVVVRYLRTYTDSTETDYDSIVVDNLHIPLVTTVSLMGFSVLSTVPSVIQNTPIEQEQISVFVGRPALSIILLVWGFYLNRVVNRVVKKINDEGKASDDHGRRYEFAPVLSNIWTLTVLTITVAALLVLWDYNISPILGAAGVAGIALGIAAKESVGNFLGGLALYVDDTYTIGDYLELDTGEAGTVVSVGIRSTTLRTLDNIEVTLPNSVLNEKRVVNRSKPGGQTRLRIDVGVAYGTDIDRFEELLREIAGDEALVQSTPEPKPRLAEFGDSALNYMLLCWVERPEHRLRVKHRLNRRIYKRCRERGVEIPYNTYDVNLYRADATPEAEVSR